MSANGRAASVGGLYCSKCAFFSDEVSAAISGPIVVLS
jgi:hypothetical protein